MKCLITGANGYIGTHLVCQLLEKGHEVHAFILRGTDRSQLPCSDIRIFEGDILRETDLLPALEGCEVVYHLASRVSPWEKDPGIYHRVNVQGTRILLDACLQQGVRRVLVSSSCGIFGPSRNKQAVFEDTPILEKGLDYYERSKCEQAQMARSYIEKGLEVVVVYPTRVFGPGIESFGNVVTRIMRGALDGAWRMIPGSGKNIGNYIYVDDAARGMILAMEKGLNGQDFILGGQNISYEELFEMVQHLSGRKMRLYRIPYFLMYLAGRLEEWRAGWTGKRPLLTTHGARKYTSDWIVSTRKIRKDLGFRPTPLEEAIRMTIADKLPAERSIQTSDPEASYA
jgi:farnesol dehydrogenase